MFLFDFEVLASTKKPPTVSYATEMTGFPLEWKESMGKDIRIAVIDTGVDNKHPDLKDAIVSAEDFTGEGYKDQNGHGTWCLGQIGARGQMKGCLPECKLLSVKAFNKKGQGSDESTIKALEWCLKQDVDVVSMSFGGGKPTSSRYHEVIKELYNKGTLLVAAAGNWGKLFPNKDTITYPAEFPEVIAVTAVDIEGDFTEFSSSGDAAEIAMPGVQVEGLWLNNEYRKLNGTSMACPTAAAIAGMIQAKAKIRFGRKLAPDVVRLIMQTMAHDLGIRGRDDKYGFGVFSFGNLKQLHTVKLFNGKKEYYVNGAKKEMDTVPFINKDNRMMVPLRFVGEGLGHQVIWDPNKPDEVTVKSTPSL